MTLRDILCTSCSDVALSVDESRSADEVERNTGETYCAGCWAPGKVVMVDDGQACDLQFRAGEDLALDLKPTLVADILWLASAEFGRQRSEGFVMVEGVWGPPVPGPAMQIIDLFEELKKSLEQAAK